MTTLKTWPDLSAAAIREGCDLSLRIWYWLRATIPDGQGWLRLEDVFKTSPWPKRKTRRWLKAGDGDLWELVEDRDGQKVRLRALEKLTGTTGTIPRKKPVFVPLEGGAGIWRANLFASFFAGEDLIEISQAKLSGIFGRSARTLLTWSKRTDLEVKHNTAWEVYDENNLDDYPPGVLKALGIEDIENETGTANYCWLEHWADLPDEKGKRWMYRKGDHKIIRWILPNSYRSGLQTGTVTTLQKKARKAVRRTLGLGRGSPTDGFLRLFYDDAGAAAKSFQEGRQEPLFMADGVRHTWDKRWLWRFHHARAKPTPKRVLESNLVWTPRISPLTGGMYHDTL